MAAPARHLLTFDGRGPGRAVEVLGDLLKADHIAVLVPGSDTSLDTYDRFRRAARALHDRTGPRHSGDRLARLRNTRNDQRNGPHAHPSRTRRPPPARVHTRTATAWWATRTSVSLLCHSYGSVVCARAAPDRDDVDDMALFGSPGTGADTAAALHTKARVWAGRGADDWIADVPHTQADLFGTTVGFGTDPVSPAFGARVFAAGDGGHSDYLKPGSVSLDNLARIVLGETSEVTHA